MNNLTFRNIENLWYLIFIVVFVALFIFLRYRRSVVLKKLGQANITETLQKNVSGGRVWVKFLMFILALGLLIFATTRPQFVTETKVDAGANNEIIIALDISNSMLASSENKVFSRLEMSKNAIFKLIDNLNNEKLGLVVFAGQAVMQIPLTNDYSAFKIILKSISPSFISAQGTSIADAIDLSISSFTPESKHEKTIIIISDGEDHEGNINDVCKKAKNENVKIFTVGIGSIRGEPINLNGKPMLDRAGNIVVSKLDEAKLKEIAKLTSGEYLNFDDKLQSLKKVYKKLNAADKDGKKQIAKYDEKYHYFLFPAFLLLILEFFVLYRKNKLLQKVKIFK